MRSADETTRFIITCSARTGSTYLVHLLRSHPRIMCHGEIFGTGRPTGIQGPLGRRFRDDPEFADELSALKEHEPKRFADEVGFVAEGADVCGFKIKYDELDLPSHAEILDMLATDRSIRVLQLSRRDLIGRYLSWHVANFVTHQTMLLDEADRVDVPPVELDPAVVRDDIDRMLARERHYAEVFAAHPTHVLELEDLEQPGAGTRDAVLDFLGVERAELQSPTKRQRERSLSESIANWDDFVAEFGGTAYARYLEPA